MRIEKGG
jgi:glutamyl/glutaminyl-tRNA synthetase